MVTTCKLLSKDADRKKDVDVDADVYIQIPKPPALGTGSQFISEPHSPPPSTSTSTLGEHKMAQYFSPAGVCKAHDGTCYVMLCYLLRQGKTRQGTLIRQNGQGKEGK